MSKRRIPRSRRRTTETIDIDELPALPPIDGDDEDQPLTTDDFELDTLTNDSTSEEFIEPAFESTEFDDVEETTGWLEDTDDADIDVGDLDDQLANITADSWLDEGTDDGMDESDGSVIDTDTESNERATLDEDTGEEGPENERFDDFFEDVNLSTTDEEDEYNDSASEPTFELTDEDRGAFALPPPRAVPHAVLLVEGMVLAAAVGEHELILCGDGVFAVPLASLRPGNDPSARRIASPADDVLTSLAFVGKHAWVAASAQGRILRSEDDGRSWESVATLGDTLGQATVELLFDPAGVRSRLWARAHGGGLFYSDDGGKHWDGPVLEQQVRTIAADGRGALLAVSSGRSPQVLRTVDGHRWDPVSVPLPAVPTLLACRGDTWAFAFSHGPGLVTLQGGRITATWALLAGATALTLVETDDGAVQLLAAIHGDMGSTLLAATIGPDGMPRGARRIADLEDIFPFEDDEQDEETDARAEAIVPLDATGRRILVITPRGLGVIARDGD